MQFQKKTSIGRSSYGIKLLIKIIIILLVLFILFVLIDRINFPSPNKEIEKNIPNETFKVVK